MQGWGESTGLQVPGVTSHPLTHGGEEWDVLVASPADTMLGPLIGDGPFPVLYVTDPSATFLVTMSVAQTLLVLSEGSLLPVAVVGVGPRTTDLARLFGQRVRDLTPTPDPPRDFDPAYPSGGSSAFLDLLVDHIAPYVEAEHNLDGTQRTLGGLSLGGLFAATALLERPEAFTRYLAVSPAMFWGDRAVPHRFAGLPAGSLTGKRVYLSVGEHERPDATETWPPMDAEALAAVTASGGVDDMVGDAATLGRLLEEAGATVTSEVLAGEHHNTVWAAAVTRGIRNLFMV